MDFSESEVSQRLTCLENQLFSLGQRLGLVEQRIAVIQSNYATKADLRAAKNSVIVWTVSAILFAQVIPNVIKAVTG